MRVCLLLLSVLACGEVPEGLPPDPGIIGNIPDGVTVTGGAAVFMLIVNFILKALAKLSSIAPLMAKKWFRLLVPLVTVVLSAAAWVMLAVMGQVTWVKALEQFSAMGLAAIGWWELVGQHIFLKPKDRAPTIPSE